MNVWYSSLLMPVLRKTVSDSVSQKEKETLLAWLNRDKESTSQPEKLTLQRKVRSTLSVPGTGGKINQ
nr:hypothetical protein [Proteus mirabilis]